MPLPNPFCGLCKPKGDAVFFVILFDIMFSLAFLVLMIVALCTLSGQEKLEAASDILIGLFIFAGAIFNLILQPAIVCIEFKKSLKGCRAWLILRILADGICCLSVYYMDSELDWVRVNGLMIILLSAPIIIHFYVWYVILAYYYYLRSKTAAAPAPPSVVIVEKRTKSNVPQRLPNSSFAPPSIGPNQNTATMPVVQTPTTTTALNLNNISSSGDHKPLH